jgi:hypothetical protein
VVLPRRDMGKSALRLVAKMAKIHPVVPRPDSKGVAQPPYMRSATAIQTSPRLNFIKSCVRDKMLGKGPYGSRSAVREALKRAAQECSAEADRRGLPKRAGR